MINSEIMYFEVENKMNVTSIHKLIHELKNPLTVCNGYLEMCNNVDSNFKNQYLNIVKEEIQRTLTIINDYNDIGKSKKLDLDEMDLSYLLLDVKNILNNLFINNNSQIVLYCDDEFYIDGDYEKLKRVFLNVLKNSLEAKDEVKDGLIVNIKIKKVYDFYEVSIMDNGVGMTCDELKHIYDEYYTTKKNGTGLGIPYIKEIIELHGGTINYFSKKGIGTTVMINLPIKY